MGYKTELDDARDLEALREMSGYEKRQKTFETLVIILPSGHRKVEELTREQLIETCFIQQREIKMLQRNVQSVLRMEAAFREASKRKQPNGA